MFQRLVSHNDDLRRLVERGYAVAFDSGHLIVRDIPYLNGQGALQWGTFVATLKHVDKDHVEQTDHQVFFAGDVPFDCDGQPIKNLAGGPVQIHLSHACADVVVQRSFSNKPRKTGAFADFFQKVESYVAIVSGPAIEKYGVSPYTFRATPEIVSPSVFKFQDTLTSRAQIGDLSAKLAEDTVAIIGLGGTGAYVLDFLVKTPVKEIRAYDLDAFHVHNAYRSPGRLLDEGELGKTKAAVYQGRYDNFRSGFRTEQRFIDDTSDEELAGVTFAFVCVDKGTSRAKIFKLLMRMGIPFIDVGMGLKRTETGSLDGMLRTTYYSERDAQRVFDERHVPLSDNPDDIYKTNIQISELNALNACLAVVKFKQSRGFYSENERLYQLLLQIGDVTITGLAHAD